MKELKEYKKKLYKLSKEQRETAWNIKYDESVRIRKEEKETYKKYKFVENLIKASEKGEK